MAKLATLARIAKLAKFVEVDEVGEISALAAQGHSHIREQPSIIRVFRVHSWPKLC